jgi:hypothetical protein
MNPKAHKLRDNRKTWLIDSPMDAKQELFIYKIK